MAVARRVGARRRALETGEAERAPTFSSPPPADDGAAVDRRGRGGRSASSCSPAASRGGQAGRGRARRAGGGGLRRRRGLPMAAARWPHLAAAALDLDAGRSGRAAGQALAATAMLEEIGHGIYAARSRMLAGRALAQAGDRTRRRPSWSVRGGSSIVRCDPLPRRGRAGAAKARPPRSTAAPGPARPTGWAWSADERELQVARLLVDRRTNTEIAAALFLSRKTIEAHIRNMFVKLGVSSRAESPGPSSGRIRRRARPERRSGRHVRRRARSRHGTPRRACGTCCGYGPRRSSG